nr:cation-translocating P-type ATPase [Prescottella sp. R16]
MTIPGVTTILGRVRVLPQRAVHAAVTTATVSVAASAGVLTGAWTAVTSPAAISPSVAAPPRPETPAPPATPPAWSDAALAARVSELAVHTSGLTVALAGRVVRAPRLPLEVTVPATVVDYQPRLRGLLASAVGGRRADVLLSVATATGNAFTQAPLPLAVDALLRTALVGEIVAARAAWRRSPVSPGSPAFPDDGPRPPCTGPVERHLERTAWAQTGAAAAVGVATGSIRTAGTAALVTAPKAARAARESFAATLGRGLADRYGVLGRGPDAVRRLDAVTALVVDPRALLTADLRVSRIRGVPDDLRTQVWDAAREAVEAGTIGEGWCPLDLLPTRVGVPDGTDAAVLVSRVRDPLAGAVLEQARLAGVTVHSLDDEALGSLRSAFDDLRTPGGTVDSDLTAIVRDLRAEGGVVAVLATGCPDTVACADLAIGIAGTADDTGWDLLVPDLAATWRVLHALPAARTASRRGIEIASGASLLGSLLMLPGTHGRGPGPVSAGAGGALWTGYGLARGVLRATAPVPNPQHDWHAMSPDRVRALLGTPEPAADADGPSRLRSAAVRARRPAEIVWDFGRSLRAELSDPLTPILATGSAASAVLGSPVDAVLVGSVLVGNAALSAAQRLHAERLLNRLLAVQDPPARTVRASGGPESPGLVSAGALRPGDVIEVRPGEVVPADGRLLTADGVEVDESSLTGESLPVDKQTAATPGVPLAERDCMLYAGTTVLTGTATAVVTAVGPATETGRATALSPAPSGRVGLQAQLRELTGKVLPVSIAGGVLVTVTSLLRGGGLQSAVTSGVAVAVAAVPEGLPLVATLAQQAAARRLTRSSALVREPRSVEALGRVDVACFDKTGTLSEDRLRVTAVRPARGRDTDSVLAAAARTSVTADGRPAPHATDRAVVEAADRLDRLPDLVLPFRAGRPYAAALTGTELVVKGAPEVVLAACTAADRTSIEDVHDEVRALAEAGTRVIAVARRTVPSGPPGGDPDDLAALCSEGLEPLGLLGLSDTLRPEAAGLLPALEERDISVRLITGDHPVTAAAIARDLGLDVDASAVVSGTEWESLSQHAQEKAVSGRQVFARMTPEQKVQIVQTLERVGHVCAMVGDGANDAAAIRAASIGIGVASRGNQPARSAADLLLLDGRVDAIVDAIDEGRQLWQRVQSAVSVLLGGNAGEIAFALLGSALTGRAPLGARQLLLVNLLTDALPAAAVAVSPPRRDRAGAGRGPDTGALWRTVVIRGTATAAGAGTAWALASLTGRPRRASTVGLVALVGAQLGQTLIDSRSPLVVGTALGSLVALGAVVSTPGVSQFLGCTPLGPVGWAQALGSAAAATTGAALAPHAIRWWQGRQSTTSTPARSSTAYACRNGGVSTDVTAPVTGSGAADRTAEAKDDTTDTDEKADNETVTAPTMAGAGVQQVNDANRRGES